MNCKQCSELLIDYSCGELPTDLGATITSHLDTCSSCTAELGRLQELYMLLERSELPSHQLRDNFHARLAGDIAWSSRAHSRPPSTRAGLFERVWPARPFAALCYSFALLACGLVSGQLLPPATLGFSNDLAGQGDGGRNIPQICSVPVPVNNEIL